MTTRIIGTGSCVPETAISNDQLAGMVDTSDEWITSRTGIRSRRIADGETGIWMAVQAARKALENAHMQPEELELIIAATCSPDLQFPSTACMIQKEIGAVGAVAFDLNAACSGFLFALNTVHAYFSLGVYKKALIVGTEVLSKLVDWTDRTTCILFGDGAGAVVAEAAETGLEGFLQYADGSKGDALICQGRQIVNPATESQNPDSEGAYLSMNGQEVFKFAVKKVPECVEDLMKRTQTDPESVRWFVLHQANRRIIQSVAKRLQLPEEKFPMNMENYGNTSAASIPILLDELNRKGLLDRGDRLILSGFGAGLTWSAVQLIW